MEWAKGDGAGDAVAADEEGEEVYLGTSKLFGNQWDGSVTFLAKDKSRRTCQLPCGVSDVAFVGSKSHIGVACDDGNVLVLESSSMGVEGWRPLHILAEHDDMVTSVGPCLSTSGKLASASADGSVKTWSLAVSGESGSLSTFSGHNAAVWDVEFHPDDEHVLASVGQDGTLRLWDDRTSGGGASVMTSENQNHPLFCLSWLKNASMQIAVGSEEGKVIIYDARDLQKACSTFKAHDDSVRRIVPAGSVGSRGAGIVSAGDDCAVKYTRADSADLKPSLVYKHKDYVRGLCTISAGKQLIEN
ncbi:hypothetical protein GUITHDRAFT_114421 [Guillardia theta CCMP2712]|uniref:Uncharacterized protein n=1 Tax=Guillardia theta (strain CCMP2712) TaxID=905079 RepID=L1IUE2_GUITC|nr:hypothetical protein GUITHDRAFT_114421 [Guillardia theta CCMP2712]EKX39460.1 hypothetical protein GUITHDRAFT_114421 [Guillardia theta CCMP2712]|eukprot:XP_005826440.1 hypothetical protein GUITHDRAFT_114421 [Guillardia theta CCMP2712]